MVSGIDVSQSNKLIQEDMVRNSMKQDAAVPFIKGKQPSISSQKTSKDHVVLEFKRYEPSLDELETYKVSLPMR